MPARRAIARTAAPLRQQVVQMIREDILQENLKPGQRLVESVLCETYDVSRTVIREALRQLESEHLITVVPNSGPIVTVLSQQDIQALYVVRANLEGLTANLFAQNASDEQCQQLLNIAARLDKEYRHGDVQSRELIKAEFYDVLISGAHNNVLRETLGLIHARIAIFRRFAFLDESRTEESIAELKTIIHEAAEAHNGQAAATAAEDHVILAAKYAEQEYISRNAALIEA
ncbi:MULTISPECIES: GntR family transcriptional regulator [Celeribacter]|uniref:GntR family transcriptional regulator n=1 Tax=Celeribacter TaxID=875170 RepID=UPI001CF9D5C9|nr:GntR family transcriptional regulator [Celeribacter naphthalenivorans]